MPLLALAAALFVAFILMFAAWGPGFNDGSEPAGLLTTPASYNDLPGSESGLIDSDRDGAPDALENYLGSSDPHKWNSSGSRIPDGWLIKHGYDPVDPNVENIPAAKPPGEVLPQAYMGAWPPSMTLTLWDVYAWGRPADWDETKNGSHESGLDPNRWDINDDGLPDGWLVHHGLDPTEQRIGERRLAGADGLTVRQAYEHRTDPHKVDTDADGVPDSEEIQGPIDGTAPDGGTRFPPSNPRSWSTAGTGVCDGYLVAHGLDPGQASLAYSDLGPSGATTVESFVWSQSRFGGDACSIGAGLDPRKVSTIDGPIPDGWLIQHGLDPLDPDVPAQVTSTSDGVDLPALAGLEEGPDDESLDGITLTVLDEYLWNRPPDWSEATQGPWQGGTDPQAADTDGDSLPDALEIRGYWLSFTTDVGPSATPRDILSQSDPTTQDTDGDGLTDYEELATRGTDPSRRDTDMDGIPDAIELADEFGLDPTRADSAGDYLRDGVRLDMLKQMSRSYQDSPQYTYPGKPGVPRTVLDWAKDLPALEDLASPTLEDVLSVLAPDGDADGDNLTNILDPDMDDDGLLNGWETEPKLYRFSQFGTGLLDRPATDPINPDTDGDGLVDGWEVKYGIPRICSNGCLSGYTLDPSAWDSDQDSVSDAKEDPDGDSIEWPIYAKDSLGNLQRDPDCCQYEYTNDREQQFGSDPNLASSASDGLSDGWKVFWGQVYPALGLADVGEVYPHPPGEPERFRVPSAEAVPRPSLDLDQADVVLGEHEYTRFVLKPDDKLEHEEIVEVHEDLPDRTAGASPSATIDVFELRGTVDFGFLDIQAAGTNPYLEDTSGDGILDWWAHMYRQPLPKTPSEAADCPAGGRLDPTIHYAADFTFPWNPLPVRQEFRSSPASVGGPDSTNPLCKDTDLDTVDDWFEVASENLDPLDPSDAGLLESEGDIDGDGVKDGEEIFGVRRDYLGSGFIRSNATNPDTDGDGLLDGETLHGPNGEGFDEDDPWTRLFLDLGIAYYRQAGRYHFLGEADESIQGSPVNPDDSATGVPTGWLAAYGLPTQNPGHHVDKYSSRQPEWWQRAEHGPWWGGVGPTDSVPAGDDLDGDGLQDRASTGGGGSEDPMPAANSLNAWRDIDWSSYPEGLGLPEADGPDPTALGGPGLNPLASRILAQSYLNPRSIGDQGYAFSPGDPSNPAYPCFDESAGPDGLRLVDGSGQTTTVLFKAQTAWISGRLIHCDTEDPWPLHGVTLEARFSHDGIPHAFGAGFTDDDGRFHFPINLARQHSIDVDLAEADIGAELLLRGQSSGVVEWSSNPSLVPPGKGRFMEIRTYASPTTAPFSDDRPAVSANSAFLQVRVEAGSKLTLDAPEEVQTGGPFKVEYLLTDSTGAPLQDKVHLQWDGATVVSTPGPDGQGQVTLQAPHVLRGDQVLSGESRPTAEMAEFVEPAQADAVIRLLSPVDLDLSTAARADAGHRVELAGRVAYISTSQGIPDLRISINLTGDGDDLPGVVTQSRTDGTFSTWLALPKTLGNGDYDLIIIIDVTDETARLIESRPLSIRSVPIITDVSREPVWKGSDAEVTGRLVEPDGSAIAQAPVTIAVATQETTVQSDHLGRFAANLTGAWPARPVQQVITFHGDEERAPRQHSMERTILSRTEVHLGGDVVARGADAEIPVRLSLPGGAGIEAAPVALHWGSEPPMTVLTDGQGVAQFQRPGNPEDVLGPVTVTAIYAGSLEGGRGPSQAAAVWQIEARAEIVLPNGTIQAGTSIGKGQLRDAGSHAPIPGADVVVEVNGSPMPQTTNDRGEFHVIEAVAANHTPEQFEIHARFNATDAFAATSNESQLQIITATAVDAQIPPRLVTGQAQMARVNVVGADGRAIDGGTVAVTTANGTSLGSGSLASGTAQFLVEAPPGTGSGAHIAVVGFSGTGGYMAQAIEVVVDIRQGVSLAVEAEPARAGGLTTLKVTARSDGEPVAFQPIHLQITGVEGGMTAMTDADGVATFQVNQDPTQMVVHARYVGTMDLSPAQASSMFTPYQPPPGGVNGTNWLLIAALAAFLLAASLVPIVRRVRRSPLEPVFRRARQIVGARGPIQEQILKAYQMLEEVAIGRGLVDDVPRTPRSVEEAFHDHLPAAARHSLDRLVTLFEVARYSRFDMEDRHRLEAEDAIQKIVVELRVEAGLRWRIAQRRKEAPS